MPPGRQNWLHSKEQLDDTPSRREGMTKEEECAVRKSICKFIEKVASNTRPACKNLSIHTAKVVISSLLLSHPLILSLLLSSSTRRVPPANRRASNFGRFISIACA
jgi:hypothetical protein